MSVSMELAKRNLLVFFRDRAAVFFSLLSVFIIISLYALFLGDIVVRDVEKFAGTNARFLMDSWIMAGTLAVTSITTTLGAFGILVNDKTKKISRDFQIAPIKRSQITAGYIISSWTISMIISIVAFIFAEVYILIYGGELLGLQQILKLFGVMVINVFSSTAMMLFLVSFFDSNNAFATASTIIGTLIGFLTGIYVPIGSLPGTIQTVIKVFPPSHAGALYRQIMMSKPFSAISASPEVIEQIKNVFGVTYQIGDKTLTSSTSILILLISGIIFFGLAVLRISRKQN